MKKKVLYYVWGGMFLLCGLLGFIQEPQGAARVALTVLSLLFFCPPAALLHEAKAAGDRRTLTLLRNLSALSLILTGLLIVLNFLSAFGSDKLGVFLNALLTLVSSPMMCSGYWVLSLFLWAVLLVLSRKSLKPRK